MTKRVNALMHRFTLAFEAPDFASISPPDYMPAFDAAMQKQGGAMLEAPVMARYRRILELEGLDHA